MNHYYLDTSALVKYYVDETDSAWLRSLISARPMPVLIVSHLATAEMHSALMRRLREGAVSNMDYARLKLIFRRDCLNRYVVVRTTVAIVEAACNLLEQYDLLTYEAVHLATALAANQSFTSRNQATLTFLSAVERLNLAAEAEGLAVDNPQQHA